MNISASSDLQRPLTSGSTEAFGSGNDVDGGSYFLVIVNGRSAPWVLSAVSLLFKDPDGNETAVTAVSGDGLTWVAAWTVPNNPGAWARAWQCQDSAGNVQISQVLQFRVINSPFGQ